MSTRPAASNARTALRTLLLAAPLLVLLGCGGPNLVDRASEPFAYGFCGLVILILDVIAVVEVLNSDWSAGSKLIWILLILFAPILGLVLYYLFAREG